ncbi:anti-sigma factor [Isoptericola sp. BMS4]|uniref:anti-sigma factor n=1 Tax=Isoptericola sp. BMS4 TaxID=2527875 RepID=UPI00141D8B7A|nr:anti-sigma factor [Isoptericola sp. BMS4]
MTDANQPTNQDAWELLPAYALDAVDDLERRTVERLLEADPEARRALDEYRDVVAAFAVDAAPPAALRDQVLSRVAATPQQATPQQGTWQQTQRPGTVPADRRHASAATGKARRRWGLAAVAAAAAVAVAVPTTVAIRATQEQQLLQERVDAVARMMADPSAALVRADVDGGGEASVLVAGDDYLFSASDLPGPGDGHDYQLWVVGAEGDVTPAGVLQAPDGSVEHLVQDVPGVGVAVTVEPDGGSEQPTTDPIVVLAEG